MKKSLNIKTMEERNELGYDAPKTKRKSSRIRMLKKMEKLSKKTLKKSQ